MLSEDMDKALRRLGYPDDLVHVHQAGLAAARRVGSKDAEARALGNLGNAYAELRRFDEAISYLQQDLTILRQTGGVIAQGRSSMTSASSIADREIPGGYRLLPGRIGDPPGNR